MSDVVTEFIERWRDIAGDAGLADDQRWPALRAAVEAAVARLGPDAEQLVTAIGYDNPAVTGLAFDVIDAANESPARSESQSRGGALALLPVILVHRDGNAALPRRAGSADWVPPLPADEAAPSLIDFLLSWEEVTSPDKAWSIHDALRSASDEDPGRLLEQRLGSEPGRSGFDGYRKSKGHYWSLRFAPVYVQAAARPFFADQDAARAWSNRAAEQAAGRAQSAGVSLLPTVPRSYREALDFGLQQFVLAGLEDLQEAYRHEIDAAARGQGHAMRVLVEPFGTPALGLANLYRLSLLTDSGYGAPLATGAEVPWRRLWFQREFVEERIRALAQQLLGLGCVIAPMIQEASTLFMESGPPRLLLVLGPDASPDAPESGEFSITSPNDQDEEQVRRWTEADEALLPQGQAVAEAVASAAGIPPESLQIAASFVFREGAWRPSFTVYRHDTTNGAAVPVRLDLSGDALQAVGRELEGRLGRRWVFCQQSGSEGFASSPIER